MLAHYRRGMTRTKIVLTTVGALVLFIICVVAIESWSFTKLIKDGAVDTLDDLNYSNKFSSVSETETANSSVVDVSTKDDPTLGNENAPLRIVEFVDFSCPFCKEENAIIRELALSNPDRVWVQARDFPVDELHTDARRAALAAACVGEQEKYWAMHDSLFANQNDQGTFSDEDLKRYAIGAGADATEYDACVKAGKYNSEIQEDYAAGAKVGVTGTPTFFVNGIKIDGAVPADIWQKILKLVK